MYTRKREHRRRSHPDSDFHSDIDAYINSDTNEYANWNAAADWDCHADRNIDAHGNCDQFTNHHTDVDVDGYFDSQRDYQPDQQSHTNLNRVSHSDRNEHRVHDSDDHANGNEHYVANRDAKPNINQHPNCNADGYRHDHVDANTIAAASNYRWRAFWIDDRYGAGNPEPESQHVYQHLRVRQRCLRQRERCADRYG